MGRTEKSQGLAPPAVRKDIRAKQAKHMINKVIPALLASNSRANRGVESSELIVDPASSTAYASSRTEFDSHDDAAYIKRKGQGRRKAKTEKGIDVGGLPNKSKGRKRQDSIDLDIETLCLNKTTTTPPRNLTVRIVTTDTLTATHILTHPSKCSGTDSKPSKKAPNVCILNMASPLRPGGGVLTGATSQEEFLCARTTLLPSLQESYYRLPELGGIWSPDILVFFNSLPLGDANGELGPAERYFVNVISAGMLRFPELEGEENEVKRLSRKDRMMVEDKMRAVLRIANQKGVRKLVLGAWGCGAYGNPVVDVAQAWRRVLDGTCAPGGKKGKAEVETWPGIEEIVFAISNRTVAANFARAFDKNIEVDSGPSDGIEDDENEEEDKVAEELRAKITEMESQISKVWNPDLKARMGSILQGLQAQLKERTGDGLVSDEEDDESSAGGARLTPEDSDAKDSEADEDDAEDSD